MTDPTPPPTAGAPAPKPTFHDRIAAQHPHLVPLKVCQAEAMKAGYQSLLAAGISVYIVAVLGKVKPNAAVMSAALAGIGGGFAGAATTFRACSAGATHATRNAAAGGRRDEDAGGEGEWLRDPAAEVEARRA
ncbi:hypothetical protein AMAG_15839 [Allomyces macrogynus ATCC 38327]|uniref:Uncharacterized protein n=1 Tax=Allomyces macrogynus (strain ATCC 38327) TaxID=578462 RepID=A0A0L0T8U5_ALLM3|nr:hypothetical protein AMAG_15839 [Allomyces macrogynus ATCC 38327]|eukprot:KNE71177.1 hypothetical protein AMAG_15839 [Allomyces macrogynus ATCC 38327]